MNRRYVVPAEVWDPQRLVQEATRRREALMRAGCATYTLGLKQGLASIVCLCCGLGSVHTMDILERYCGFCHAFHAEWREPDDPET